MTTKLPEGVQMAIDEYLRLQRGRIIFLSQAMAFVYARSGTDFAANPVGEAIAEAAVVQGRSVHFDRLTPEGASQVEGR